MFNAIRQHAVSWPLAIGEEPSDGEQKRLRDFLDSSGNFRGHSKLMFCQFYFSCNII